MGANSMRIASGSMRTTGCLSQGDCCSRPGPSIMLFAPIARYLVVAACAAVVAGCTALPDDEQSRLHDLPLAATQAEIMFTLTTGRRRPPCQLGAGCPATTAQDASDFAEQVGRLAARLQRAAQQCYPDLASRAPELTGGRFDVYVAAGEQAGSDSSPDGRIAINAGLAGLQPDDTVLAFVIAREMGHVIARHHEEKTAAGMLTSLLFNLVIPGSGLLKSLLAAGASRVAAFGKGQMQSGEANLIAGELLLASGFDLPEVADVTALAVDTGPWTQELRRSSALLSARLVRPANEATTVAAGESAPTPSSDIKLARNP